MIDEAEAKPEVEAENEARPAEEAVPVEEVNSETADAAVKVNGITPAAEPPAEEATSPSNDANLSASQEWVSVPRPEETASASESVPVASQSWADDHPEPTAEVCLGTPSLRLHI